MAIQPLLFNPDFECIPFALSNGSSINILFDNLNRTFWINQKQMAQLFDIDESRISHHIRTLKDEWATYAQSAGVEIRKIKLSQEEGSRLIEREIEHYNHDTVIDVGYRARSNERTFWFRRTVNEIVNEYMQKAHQRDVSKAQHARAVDVTGYILAGKTQAHAEKRVDMKSTIKRLNAIIIEISDAKMIGQVIGTEYRLLFGKLADELKIILHTKNIRDALPYLQLTYLDTIETSLVTVLSAKQRMSREDLLKLVESVVTPLASHLKTICEIAGIDVITGHKHIGGGK